MCLASHALLLVTCPHPATPFSSSFLQYSISEYRDRLYMEIVKRKKEIRKKMKEKEAARAASKAAKSRAGYYHSSYSAASGSGSTSQAAVRG